MNDMLGFVTEHGALVIFAVVFAEQIGLPLPAIPILIAAGVLAGNGGLDVAAVGIAAAGAALAADWIWYDLGRRRGHRVLEIICRLALEPRSCIMRTEQLFKTHGVRSLIAAKFVPGLSTIAPPLAGIAGLAVGRFLLYDGIGIVLWVGSSVGLGYAFSDRVDAAMEYAAFMTPAALLGLAVTLSLYVAAKAWRRRGELREVPRIEAEQLRAKLESPILAERPVVVDVRPQAIAERDGIIPGALVLPTDEFLRRYREVPLDREVVLYCACPGDVASADAARYLRKKGWPRVQVLKGGIEAWRMIRPEADSRPFAVTVPAAEAKGPSLALLAEMNGPHRRSALEPVPGSDDPVSCKEGQVGTRLHQTEEVVC